jgi:hypothetical protein
MAIITMGMLQRFVSRHGDIKIVDSGGKARMFQPDLPNLSDLMEKADRFWYRDRWHSRETFLKVLNSHT